MRSTLAELQREYKRVNERIAHPCTAGKESSIPLGRPRTLEPLRKDAASAAFKSPTMEAICLRRAELVSKLTTAESCAQLIGWVLNELQCTDVAVARVYQPLVEL